MSPFTTAPNVIEQSDFTLGLDNVSEVANMDPNALQRVSNLLTDIGTTGSLVTRHGFARFIAQLGHSGHHIKNIHRYHRDGNPYLILVITDESADANNVMLYEVDLEATNFQRIDTAGVAWDNSNAEHFGVTVLEVYYGGSPGNDIYSWDGTTWNDDATAGDYKTLKDDINTGINTNSEFGRDFAFTNKEHVIYGGDAYVPVRSIRYDTWDDATHYEKGNRVSRKNDYGSSGSDSYWKSFRCIQAHKSDDTSDTDPGTGTDWRDYWTVVRLDLPKNDDDVTSDDWYFQPAPHGTPVGVWFAYRLWLRADHVKDKSTLMFSAPLGINKGEDIPDTNFDVQDWAPGNDKRGPGGGWLPFNDGKGTGVIEALHVYNDQLFVFKRRSVWVLTGESEETFSPRIMHSGSGAVGPHAVTELDGLMYYLADDGLYVSDGTQADKVQGFESMAKYIEARIDGMSNRDWDVDEDRPLNRQPHVWTWENKVWMSFPNDANMNLPFVTIVYDPRYQSFWLLDLPIISARPARVHGKPMMFFGADPTYGGRSDLLYRYDHPDSHVASEEVDDDGHTDQAFQSVAWSVESAWWPFSVFRAQRRIRRVWALVKSVVSQSVDLKQKADYVDSTVTTATSTVASATPAYIEGKWMKDCHAIDVTVAGTKAPAGVYGIAVHTEPRRARYHA